jgi:hypothetical protein|tara:strand:- start:307 stop:654 length:348 start_codon:yes stop_codon:yes gene_type:complete
MDKLNIYVVDIDGTICIDTGGDYKDAEPHHDRIAVLNDLYDKGHTINYFTARGMGRTDNNVNEAYKLLYEYTKQQLDGWGCKYNDLFLGKPYADYYVDNKGVNDTHFFRDFVDGL